MQESLLYNCFIEEYRLKVDHFQKLPELEFVEDVLHLLVISHKFDVLRYKTSSSKSI